MKTHIIFRQNRKHKPLQNGVAMIEFAVVLPFLLLTLAIVGEIGYVMYQQNILIKSAESGGRFISVNSGSGTGFVDISAQDIQNTRNVVLYGNPTGVGNPIISDLNPLNINVTCTNGTRNGHCIKLQNLTPISVEINYTYNPIMGDFFDNVTGFNYFPLQLTAITIVETI